MKLDLIRKILVATKHREDLAKLPTGDGAGSTCIVIEDSSVHMLDSKGQWKEI